MAENVLIGRVIAISEEETIPSADGKKEPFKKRQLYLNCTQYDQWTHEPIGGENTPLLEFGGKVLDQLNDMVKNGLAKDAVVQVKFKVVGRKVTKEGKLRIFNDVRPYAIEFYRPEYFRNDQPTNAAPAPQPAPQPAPAPAPTPQLEPQQVETTNDGKDGLPF